MRCELIGFASVCLMAVLGCDEESNEISECDFSETCYDLDNECSGDTMYYVCNDTGYKCIQSCVDMCAASGKIYIGECSFSSEENKDVCYCVSESDICDPSVTCGFGAWDRECYGDYMNFYCMHDGTSCILSCQAVCELDGLDYAGECANTGDYGTAECACE